MSPPVDINFTSSAPGERYAAVVLAGKRPGVDPVAAANGETYKAMVEIGGAPMLTHVVGALCGSENIGNVIVVAGEGLKEPHDIKGLLSATAGKTLKTAEAKGTISESVMGAIASQPDAEKFLITTSDHPLLTSAMIDDFLNSAAAHKGISIAFVDRDTIEREHPGMRRTYLPFRGAKVSGANLFAITSKEGLDVIDFFQRLEKNRKSPVKMVSSFGFINLIGFLLRAFTLEQGFARLSKVVKCDVQPILLRDANAAVDVDSVADHAVVEQIFSSRPARAGSQTGHA